MSMNRASKAPSLAPVSTSTSRWPASSCGARGVGAPGQRVVEVVQPDRCAELVGHPVLHHLELHRPDRGEHRRLVAAQVRAQHLHDALGVELLDAPAELLEPAASRAAGHGEVLGGEARDRRERPPASPS